VGLRAGGEGDGDEDGEAEGDCDEAGLAEGDEGLLGGEAVNVLVALGGEENPGE